MEVETDQLEKLLDQRQQQQDQLEKTFPLGTVQTGGNRNTTRRSGTCAHLNSALNIANLACVIHLNSAIERLSVGCKLIRNEFSIKTSIY